MYEQIDPPTISFKRISDSMYNVCRDNRQAGQISNCACPEYKLRALLAQKLTGEITADGKQIFVTGDTKFSIGFVLPLIVIHVVKFAF
jgi:hypothetical protein